jgi:threonine dehydrogenase-like Zn-dependent dehydrogenase
MRLTNLPQQTRILVLVGQRALDYITVPLAAPKANEVLIKTLYSGISHGTEMNVYRGVAPQWSKTFDPKLRLFVPVNGHDANSVPPRGYYTPGDTHWGYPLAYGYANVGRIIAVGEDVRSVRLDDLVYTYQPHQEYCLLPENAVIPLPNLDKPAHGVIFSNINTAYSGVLDSDIRIDDTVVIFGQGLIGLLVTQLMRRTAARRIITVDRIAARRDMSLKMGADVALDPAETDVALAVRTMTGGRGADVVIEVSGSYAALGEAIRTAAPNTTITVMSWYGGQGDALRLSDEFHHNRITLKCSQVSAIDPHLSATHSLSRRREHVLEAYGYLQIDPLLVDYIPFSEAARAYDLVDLHSDQTIQVVLDYNSGS